MRCARAALILCACGRGASTRPSPSPSVAHAPGDARVAVHPALRFAYAIDGDAARATEVLDRRFALLAIGAAASVEHGEVVVELPELDPEVIAHVQTIIQRVGRFEVRPVDDDLHAQAMVRLAQHVAADPDAAARGITVVVDRWRGEADPDVVHTASQLVASDRREGLTIADGTRLGCIEARAHRRDPHPPAYVECSLTGRQVLEDYLATMPADLRPPADHELRLSRWVQAPTLTSGGGPRWDSSYVARAVLLDGRAIADAQVGGSAEEPAVTITLDADGTRRLGEYTTDHVGDRVALIVDGVIVASPIVDGAVTDGRLTIRLETRDLDADAGAAAADLALLLRAGALPGPMLLETEQRLPP